MRKHQWPHLRRTVLALVFCAAASCSTSGRYLRPPTTTVTPAPQVISPAKPTSTTAP